MTPDEHAAILRDVVRRYVPGGLRARQHLDALLELARRAPQASEPEPLRAAVILFLASGKYYTAEEWRWPATVPDESPSRGEFTREVIGPFDMLHSPDFRRIEPDGKVLVVEQEPWGYPFLL